MRRVSTADRDRRRGKHPANRFADAIIEQVGTSLSRPDDVSWMLWDIYPVVNKVKILRLYEDGRAIELINETGSRDVSVSSLAIDNFAIGVYVGELRGDGKNLIYAGKYSDQDAIFIRDESGGVSISCCYKPRERSLKTFGNTAITIGSRCGTTGTFKLGRDKRQSYDSFECNLIGVGGNLHIGDVSAFWYTDHMSGYDADILQHAIMRYYGHEQQ